MEQHYVGSNFVTFSAKMPGFDYWETNRLHGWGLVSYHWKHFWNKVIDWFINNL